MDKKRTFAISSGVLSLALVLSAAGVASAHGGEDPVDTQRQGQGMGQMGGQGMMGDQMGGQGMMSMMHGMMGGQGMFGGETFGSGMEMMQDMMGDQMGGQSHDMMDTTDEEDAE